MLQNRWEPRSCTGQGQSQESSGSEKVEDFWGEVGRGKAHAHRAQAFCHTGPEVTAGKVQGGVLLLLHCCFPTIGALYVHSSSSSEASPNRFRLRVPTVHWYHLRLSSFPCTVPESGHSSLQHHHVVYSKAGPECQTLWPPYPTQLSQRGTPSTPIVSYRVEPSL